MYVDLLIIVFVATIVYLYNTSKKIFNYWKEKNIPYAKPLPLFGNYINFILLQKPIALISQELCKKFRREPYFGTYFGTNPALVILSPEIIKLVLIKDFYYFNSRDLMKFTNRDTLLRSVLFQYGDMWKILRSNLTPLFSSAKMRSMFHLIEKCALSLEDMLDYETQQSEVLGARSLMVRYTIDCISSCGFGIEANTMGTDAENHPFTKIGRVIFATSKLRGFATVMRQIWPDLFYGAGFKSLPKKIDDFFNGLITGVFEGRNFTPTQRNDFVDLLLTLKKNKVLVGDRLTKPNSGVSEKEEVQLDDAVLLSQSVVFFAAGFETSAGTLSLTIYELAKNQRAQELAQTEIDDYLKRNNNKVSDDCVQELAFLEACILETLRLYPVAAILTREVVEGYTFPSGLHLERGTRVHLPVYYLHRDAELFPDPEEYKPERFMPDAEHEIKPYSFFPFGEGPRTCLGKRFAYLQVMAGLITILKTYSVELAPGAPRVLDLQKTTFLLQPVSGLPVRMSRRSDWDTRVYNRA